ncbi:MAG: hypothetical protein ABIQ31_01695 [Ferruginibacter sp.]
MDQHYFDNTTKAGTASGTLLTIFINIKSEDLFKTAILAGVGALVSFSVTVLLKALVKWFSK